MAQVKHLRTTKQNNIHNELRAYPTPSSDAYTNPTTPTYCKQYRKGRSVKTGNCASGILYMTFHMQK